MNEYVLCINCQHFNRHLDAKKFLLIEQSPGPSSRCDHTSWFLRLELQRAGESLHSKWKLNWWGFEPQTIGLMRKNPATELSLHQSFSFWWCSLLRDRWWSSQASRSIFCLPFVAAFSSLSKCSHCASFSEPWRPGAVFAESFPVRDRLATAGDFHCGDRWPGSVWRRPWLLLLYTFTPHRQRQNRPLCTQGDHPHCQGTSLEHVDDSEPTANN